jgi:alginate production protein
MPKTSFRKNSDSPASFLFEFGVSEQLFPVSTADIGIPAEDQDVLRVLSHVAWEWSKKQRLGLFFLYQQDHSSKESVKELIRDEFLDPVDGDFTWLGLRAQNRFTPENAGDFNFWTDVAWISGKERSIAFDESDRDGISIVDEVNNEHIQGWALDVGLTWEVPLVWTPSLTIGYAIGSREFRQTGLQDNNDRFRAINRFRYYGELLRPELSNLQIWTVAVTIPFLQNSSVSALYHYYRQVEAQPFLRQGRIRPDPNGINPSIGQELDLVIALEEWNHWEMEFVTAVFQAGSAYGEQSGNVAVDVVFKVNYNF